MQDLADFLTALARLPGGYSEGRYAGARWGATLERSKDGRRTKLLTRELGGQGLVSFNLYTTRAGGPTLKPCEMPAETVIAFVRGYRPEATPTAS